MMNNTAFGLNLFKRPKLYLKIIIGFLTIFLVFCYGPKKVGKYDKILDYGIIQQKYEQDDQSSKTEKQKKIEALKEKVEKLKQEKAQKEKETKEIDNSVESIVQDIFEKSHKASSSLKMDEDFLGKLCNYNLEICAITTFDADYSIDQKIKYQAMIIYLIKKLENFLGSNYSLVDILYKIKLVNGISDRRGYAGYSTITIDTGLIATNKEFFEVLTHEMGHIIDLGVLQGTQGHTKSTIYTEFGEEVFSLDDPSLNFYKMSRLSESTRASLIGYKDFVSGYGMTDPFEDFAECFNLYINHHLLFEEMKTSSVVLTNKYNYIKKYFGDNYIFDGSNFVYKVQQNPYRRPWDTTKIN